MAIIGAAFVTLETTCRVQATQINLGEWKIFEFGEAGEPATGNGSLGPPPWTFTAPDVGALLKVTDAFLAGDEFDIFDFEILIGSTSTVPVDDEVSCNPPNGCFRDPSFSHGVFDLAAGPHSITITPSASPYGAGAAYFRADPVPEPSSVLGALAFGAFGAGWMLKRRQKQKVTG